METFMESLIFIKSEFQKINTEGKLERIFRGKQVPSTVPVWVSMLMTQKLLININIVFDSEALILRDCTLSLYEI